MTTVAEEICCLVVVVVDVFELIQKWTKSSADHERKTIKRYEQVDG